MFSKSNVQEKKDYIAQIAARIFSEKGYKAASLQDVSREVGISKAAVYYYFQSKDDLLGYLMLSYSERFLGVLKRSIEENINQGISPDDMFKKLVRVYAGYINSDNAQRALILRERHQLSEAYKEELSRKEQEMFRLLKNELLKIPGLNKRINPNVIAFLFISMSHWLGYWVKENGNHELENIIDQNIAVILNGSMLTNGKCAFE